MEEESPQTGGIVLSTRHIEGPEMGGRRREIAREARAPKSIQISRDEWWQETSNVREASKLLGKRR